MVFNFVQYFMTFAVISKLLTNPTTTDTMHQKINWPLSWGNLLPNNYRVHKVPFLCMLRLKFYHCSLTTLVKLLIWLNLAISPWILIDCSFGLLCYFLFSKSVLVCMMLSLSLSLVLFAVVQNTTTPYIVIYFKI